MTATHRPFHNWTQNKNLNKTRRDNWREVKVVGKEREKSEEKEGKTWSDFELIQLFNKTAKSVTVDRILFAPQIHIPIKTREVINNFTHPLKSA